VSSGIAFFFRLRGLRDHRNCRDLLSDRSDNNGDLGLVFDGGGGGSFVGYTLE
jgi:hypothetical protein